MGDLNSNFTINCRGGCHKGNGWLNRSHELANQLSPLLATHCTPRGTNTWIDHILVHDTSNRIEQRAIAASEGRSGQQCLTTGH